MKIEKINDTQIRVTLSHTDLNPRDINISELAYGSKKAQDLFKDMMTQAYEEFGFETEDTPLMIEAVPLSTESIMIVITKIEDPSLIDDKLGAFGERPTHRTFQNQHLESEGINNKSTKEQKGKSKEKKNSILIYSFNSLDDVTNTGHKISSIYCGMNSLYKQGNDYFLVLQPNFMHKVNQEQLESALDEFGQRHISSSLVEPYLMEHGEILIKNNAIEVLTTYL